MLRKPLIILGYLFLTASAFAMPHHHEPDVSFLSDKAKAVLTEIKGLHEKIHAKIEAAADESGEKVWKDIGRSVHETCMIGPGPGQRPPRPEEGDKAQAKGERRGPPVLSDEKKQEFETKLTSEACSQAISNAEGKLQ